MSLSSDPFLNFFNVGNGFEFDRLRLTESFSSFSFNFICRSFEQSVVSSLM